MLYKDIGFDRAPPPRRMRDARIASADQASSRWSSGAILERLPDVQTRHNRNFQPSASHSYGRIGVLASSVKVPKPGFPGAREPADASCPRERGDLP
jgi:hypothetical protein